MKSPFYSLKYCIENVNAMYFLFVICVMVKRYTISYSFLSYNELLRFYCHKFQQLSLRICDLLKI